MILSPSLLSADFTRLERELAELEEAGLTWLHLDVMDGSFVPNISFGQFLVKALRPKSGLFFDTHLMVREPERHLESFAAAGSDMLVLHVEACLHLERALREIRRLGMRAGVALNPGTPLAAVEEVLDACDMVLLMSVNPGFSGQSFIPSSLDKLRRLKAMLTARGLATDIQVDGGVSPENARALVDAGATILVSGSAFFNFPPYKERLETFRRAVSLAV